MRISDVLQTKGSSMTTLAPSATVGELVDVLAARGIGAVIVSEDGRSPAGMVSERDVVRRLQSGAEALMDQRLDHIMSADVAICAPTDRVDAVLQLMTDRRIRHVPVLDEGQLVGLVSIGDLVKSRIDELALERDQLSSYISGAV